MMKPMLGLSLQVSMPACVHVLGVWADAGAERISANASIASKDRTQGAIDFSSLFLFSEIGRKGRLFSIAGGIRVVAASGGRVAIRTIVGGRPYSRGSNRGGAGIVRTTISGAPCYARKGHWRERPADDVDEYCCASVGA